MNGDKGLGCLVLARFCSLSYGAAGSVERAATTIGSPQTLIETLPSFDELLAKAIKSHL